MAVRSDINLLTVLGLYEFIYVRFEIQFSWGKIYKANREVKILSCESELQATKRAGGGDYI